MWSLKGKLIGYQFIETTFGTGGGSSMTERLHSDKQPGLLLHWHDVGEII